MQRELLKRIESKNAKRYRRTRKGTADDFARTRKGTARTRKGTGTRKGTADDFEPRAVDPEGSVTQAADDAADAKWHPLTDLPKLAFDHESIITDAVKASGKH